MIDIGGHSLVARHFLGKSSPRAGRRLFRHLQRCTRCREEYRISSLLEALPGDGEARAQARMARAIFPRRRRRLAWGAGGFGLAFACAAFLLWLGRAPEPFRARGDSPGVTGQRPASATLGIYRMTPKGGGLRVGHVVGAGEPLAFSYANPPPDAYCCLMVFARDGAGQVYWFWPGWQSPAENPASISIVASREPIELGEYVRHSFPRGPLTVIGLFSRRPYRAREVEAALAAGVEGLAKLDAFVWSESLDVVTSQP